MNRTNDVEKLIKRIDVTPDAERGRRALDEVLQAQEKANKVASADLQPGVRRIIMKSPIAKFAAAAGMSVAFLISMIFFDRGTAPAYGLEETIKANHTIKTIHLRMFPGEGSVENDEYADCWVKYDDAGLVSNFRQNFYGDVRDDDDNLKFQVWNDGVLKTWLPLKNVVIVIRVNDVETYWQNFPKHFDPKLILQRLYDSQQNGAIELKIDQPARDGDPIYVEAINSTDNTRLELVVDSKTKLVKELSRYSLGEQKDELDIRIKYFSYNEPIDPSVFRLGGIPDDALVYDQIDQLVGLEKGDLTDEEIAIKVVREGLEATMARDYDEVSRLMEGDPGDTIELFIEEELRARLVRIISIGQPEPHETWKNILCVPCEIEVEDGEGAKWTVNIVATAKAIGYQPGCRWIMHTDLEIDPLDRIVKGTIVPGVQVGAYTFDMSKDDVLTSLGTPNHIFYGGEKYTLDNLPRRYYMSFGDLSFGIVDGSVKGITALRPSYKFTNGLGVGDSEQDIIRAFGNDFRLEETEWKDFLTYEAEGLSFEIHKNDRTVMEINVFRPEVDALDGIVKGTIVPGAGVGDYALDMSKDDVLRSLGKPNHIFYGDEEYTLDDLPRRYYMTFGDLSFGIVDGVVKGIGVHRPSYKFTNGLGVGDSEQDIVQAFGDNFRLKESEWKDFLTYDNEGIQFEIHKKDRTAMELSVFCSDGD